LLDWTVALRKVCVVEVELFKGIAAKFILIDWSREGNRNSTALLQFSAIFDWTLGYRRDFLLWRTARMPMKLFDVPLCGGGLDLGDLGYVVLVVEAVSEHVPEVSEGPLQGVCHGLLLCLFKSGCLSGGVSDLAVPNVLETSAGAHAPVTRTS
jgi:hypothetical protein